MELATTFRGLNETECTKATRALERSSGRLDRLLDKPTTLKVVVDGAPPEYRVVLSMGLRGNDLTSEDAGHDLAIVIGNACEKLRVQMVRTRHRKDSRRHKAADRSTEET
jgi:ribosome-associated translation inhibitor RaiA